MDSVNSELRDTLILLSEQYIQDKASYEAIVNYLSSLHSNQVGRSSKDLLVILINILVARKSKHPQRPAKGVGPVLPSSSFDRGLFRLLASSEVCLYQFLGNPKQNARDGNAFWRPHRASGANSLTECLHICQWSNWRWSSWR